MMKKLLLLSLVFSQISFAITAGKVWRIPPAGTQGKWGAVDLASPFAVTGLLPKINFPAVAPVTGLSGTFLVNGGSVYVQIASVAITTTGRPVRLQFQGVNIPGCTGLTCPTFRWRTAGAFNQSFLFRWLRDGVQIEQIGASAVADSGGNFTYWLPSSIAYFDSAPPAGAHTYSYEVWGSGTLGSGNYSQIAGNDLALVVYEL